MNGIFIIFLFSLGIGFAANIKQKARSTTLDPPYPHSHHDHRSSETFETLLEQLEHTEPCNRTVAGKLVHNLINDSFTAGKFPQNVVFILNVINDVHHLPNAKTNPLKVTELDKSPITPSPTRRNDPGFGLQLICQDIHPGNPNIQKHQNHQLHPDAIWTPIAVYYNEITKKYLTVRLPVVDLDFCSLSSCQDSKCSWTVHGQAKIWAKSCCGLKDDFCRNDWDIVRKILYIVSITLALASIFMIPVVLRERRRQQQESRGWALMELFFVGAAVLYLIPLLDWMSEGRHTCFIAVWMREIGFTLFYGSIVIKIYRNLQEYRVRKAHHVIVREQDMLKYLTMAMVMTIGGLLAWSLGSLRNNILWNTNWPQCPLEKSSIMWAMYEFIFLLCGARLCYKARSSHWTEKNQFTVAVLFEAIVTLLVNCVRYSIRGTGSRDTLLMITALQIFVVVTINITVIITPKFISIGGESNRRTLTMSGAGNSGRAHPSLAKLRDNLINGTIDFAEVPIIDMNPEDIRAELKRVYTQLRMYKLKNLYQDNPHISKRKGGKKTSDKTTKNRRISIPPTSSSPKIRRVDEEDEKSDLTVESAPHNIYLSTNKIQLESIDQSVRV